MKKIAAVLVIPLLALGACSDNDDSEVPPDASQNGHRLYVESVEKDGRDYTCIVYDDYDYAQGGLWCQEEPEGER